MSLAIKPPLLLLRPWPSPHREHALQTDNDTLRAQLSALMAERVALTLAAAPLDAHLRPDAVDLDRHFTAPGQEALAAERRARATEESVAAMKEGWRQPQPL